MYEGPERRSGRLNIDDHDTLIEIHTDIKHLVSKVDVHLQDDKEAFRKIGEGQEFLKKVVWGALGAGSLVAFLLKFIH